MHIILSPLDTWVCTDNSCMWQPLKECIFKFNEYMYKHTHTRTCITQCKLLSVSLFGFVTLRIFIFKRLSNRFYYYAHILQESYYIWKWENFNRNESDGQNIYSISVSANVCPVFTHYLSHISFTFRCTNKHTKTHIERANMTHWWAFTVIYIYIERWVVERHCVQCTQCIVAMNK